MPVSTLLRLGPRGTGSIVLFHTESGGQHSLRRSKAFSFVLARSTSQLLQSSRLDYTRHASLDTRLSKAGNDERRFLFVRRSEDGKELGNGAAGAICLLDQVDCASPPSEQSC